MVLSDKVYTNLKWVAQIGLPALGTLYFALAGIWGLPYGEQVIGTITAVDTFLGVVLGISSNNYAKSELDGTLHVDTESSKATLTQVEFSKALTELIDGKNTITLRVNTDANLSEAAIESTE